MARPRRQRGYVLVTVIVLGVVLASLSTVLLIATNRDQSEATQQSRTVRAMYAAEGAVAIGMDLVEQKLAGTTASSLFLGADAAKPTDTTTESSLEADARAAAAKAMPYAVLDKGKLSIRFYDAATNTISNKLVGSTATIQVLATATVENASATVADAMTVTVSSRFYNYAILADADLETDLPGPMLVSGAVHANGDIWLSNQTAGAAKVNFLGKVSSASLVKSVSEYASTIKVTGTTGALGPPVKAATTDTLFPEVKTGLAAIDTDLPKKLDPYTGAAASGSEDQATYLKRVFGDNVKDISSKTTAVDLPLSSLSSPGNVTSRPPICTDGTKASFPQSPQIALIKRPAAAYSGDKGSGGIYDDGLDPSDPYTADFGPKPSMASGPLFSGTGPTSGASVSQATAIEVTRSVPKLGTALADDELSATAAAERFFWKATIRIIDGIWYRGSDGAVIFDPEQVDYTTTAPSPTDLNHKFARVLRYSWWWDMRENRVYCTSGTGCVTDGLLYQRGAQVRATDFDAAAFMALLEDADARKLMFKSDSVPSTGITLYMSETYDPKFEDANTALPRASNVRNFLDFQIMHNHVPLTSTQAAVPPAPFPKRLAPSRSTSSPVKFGRTPYELGWFPENIWGINAPEYFNSLTPAYKEATMAQTILTSASSDSDLAKGYATSDYGNRTAGSSMSTLPKGVNTASEPTTAVTKLQCRDRRHSGLTSSLMPPSRPASFTTPSFAAPCIMAAATPMGAENAIRIVRATSLPAEGFTFVTDNRLYIMGNVAVAANDTRKIDPAGAKKSSSASFPTTVDVDQDLKTAGKVAIWADSITVLSDRFDERERQTEDLLTSFEQYWTPSTGSTRAYGSAGKGRPYGAPSSMDGGNAPADFCYVTGWGMLFGVASETRINATLVAGDVPDCRAKGASFGNSSGGINNLIRLAEDWTGRRLIINGGVMNLYRSERGNSRFLPPGGGDAAGAMSIVGRFSTPQSPWNKSSSSAKAQSCVFQSPAELYISFDSALSTTQPPSSPSGGGSSTTNRVRWVRR